MSRGWDSAPEESLIELLSGLLTGKAQKTWYDWVQEDPNLIYNYASLKLEFQGKLGGDTNVWKLLSEFESVKMKTG